MRKAILSVVVALALAGVVSALPTTAGGTLYINWDTTNNLQSLGYLTLGTDWLATSNTRTTLANVADTGQAMNNEPANPGYGTISTFAKSEATPHTTAIVMGALFNGTDSTETNPGTGYDIMSVTSNASKVILNDGDPGSRGTGRQGWTLAVDSGFTPNGEATGVVMNYGSNYYWNQGCNIFTEETPGAYTTRTSIANTGIFNQLGQSRTAYSALDASKGYTVDFNSFTGVIFANQGDQAGANAGGAMIVYKIQGGGYYQVPAPMPVGHPVMFNMNMQGRLNTPLAVGDTNNDGKPDFYYWSGATTGYSIVHGMDLTDNGNFSDAGETWDFGSNGSLTATGGDMTIVKGTDGTYALLVYGATAQAGAGDVVILPMNADGDFDAAQGATVLATLVGLPTGAYGSPSILFVPTAGGAPIVPEPATMLLVGTGILGLAGVIRRRLIG